MTNNKGENKNYIGLAKNFKSRYRKHKDSLENKNPKSSTTLSAYAKNFKKRYRKHKDSLETKNPKNSTTLSTYVWKEKEEGREPLVSWKILEKNVPLFNPVTRECKLCLRKVQHCIQPSFGNT